jgi:hypothetical protein
MKQETKCTHCTEALRSQQAVRFDRPGALPFVLCDRCASMAYQELIERIADEAALAWVVEWWLARPPPGVILRQAGRLNYHPRPVEQRPAGPLAAWRCGG